MPPSEFAVLKKEGTCKPKGCYYKEYTVYLADSQNLNLTGVIMGEDVKNRRPVDRRPVCPLGPANIQSVPLEKEPNGLFAITDTLGIPGEVIITTPCAHQEDQFVMVGSCMIQKNILTFEADPSGARRISRSDERKQ